MRLVYGVAHCGGIAELDGLVAGLVSGGEGQEGCNNGDESLKFLNVDDYFYLLRVMYTVQRNMHSVHDKFFT